MKILKLRYKRIALIIISISLIALFLLYTQIKKLQTVKNHFEKWMNLGLVDSHTYYQIHCQDKPKWDLTMKWPPVQDIGRQLHIEKTESIFVNGLGCGEWLQALHATFPNTKLYGVDAIAGSVFYVSTLVNGTFEKALPYELENLKAVQKENVMFDHAIVDATLSIYDSNQQCLAIRKLLPLLKPGGSMYIGRNFEDCQTDNENYITELKRNKITMLSKCFWSDSCLQGRPDIAEILYAYEDDIYEGYINKKDISVCATAVFIYKNIIINKDKHKGPLISDSKPGIKAHRHECTRSTFLNSSKAEHNVRESIKNAVKKIKEKGLDLH